MDDMATVLNPLLQGSHQATYLGATQLFASLGHIQVTEIFCVAKKILTTNIDQYLSPEFCERRQKISVA